MRKYYRVIISVVLIGIISIFVINWMKQFNFRTNMNIQAGQHVTKQQLRTYPKYQQGQYFRAINLSVDQADVKVQQGNDYRVQVQNQSSNPVISKHHGQTLIIRQWRDKKHQFEKHSAQVIITVPQKDALKIAYLSSDSGDLSLQNLKIKKSIAIAVDSSPITINNCRLPHIHLAFDDSKLSVQNSHLSELSIACDDGQISLQDSRLTGRNRIASDDVKLRLQNINSDLGYKFTGDEITGSYYNQKITSEGIFVKNRHSKNQLHILGDEVNLTVK